MVTDGATAAALDQGAVMVDGRGRGGKVVLVMELYWCWASGVRVTKGHFVEAAGRVPVGVVGYVVGYPAEGCPLLDQGKGGALQ